MQRTVFIVGAGASADFGFPLGRRFAEQISEIVRDEINSRCQGPLFDSVLRSGVAGNWETAARDLSGGLIAARSIDRFLDSRRDRNQVIEFGKRGIAEAIARSERSSPMGRLGEADWGQIHQALVNSNGTWLARLFALLQEGCPPDECERIFQSCTFITFNYDRTIERYLQLAFRHMLDRPVDVAEAHVAAIRLVHVYGSLGDLPLGDQRGIPFAPSPDRVEDFASSIRTFTEGVLDGTRAQIHELIANAELIAFLGFGFDPLNVRALFPEPLRPGQRVIGTNLQVDRRDFGSFVESAFGSRGMQGKFHETTCADLIPTLAFRAAVGL